MYAAGATPDSGCVVKNGAGVPWSPAAMPETWVPCSLYSGSNGRFAYFHCGDGGGNARATITLAVVKPTSPFGKPAGMVKPTGERNGCVWSTPSSMIPIFIPWPAFASVGPQTVGAPISCGVRSRAAWYVALGHTLATPGTRASLSTAPPGTTTARAFSVIP